MLSLVFIEMRIELFRIACSMPLDRVAFLASVKDNFELFCCVRPGDMVTVNVDVVKIKVVRTIEHNRNCF